MDSVRRNKSTLLLVLTSVREETQGLKLYRSNKKHIESTQWYFTPNCEIPVFMSSTHICTCHAQSLSCYSFLLPASALQPYVLVVFPLYHLSEWLCLLISFVTKVFINNFGLKVRDL